MRVIITMSGWMPFTPIILPISALASNQVQPSNNLQTASSEFHIYELLYSNFFNVFISLNVRKTFYSVSFASIQYFPMPNHQHHSPSSNPFDFSNETTIRMKMPSIYDSSSSTPQLYCDKSIFFCCYCFCVVWDLHQLNNVKVSEQYYYIIIIRTSAYSYHQIIRVIHTDI